MLDKKSITHTGRLCFAHIPARYVSILMISLGIFLDYSYKSFLGVTIVAMVRHDSKSKTMNTECPVDDIQNGANSSSSFGEFEWTDSQQTVILGAFYYGYIFTNFPAGIIYEKLSGKWLVGCSVLTTGILSAIGPIVMRLGGNSIVPIVLIRIGQGFSEGIMFPIINAMIAKWMPKIERSRAVSLTFVGSSLGVVVSLSLSGYLCSTTIMGGWPAIYYFLGIGSFIWFIFWSLFVFDSPDTHPYISQNEYNYIKSGQGYETNGSKKHIPWKSMLTSYRVYSAVITHFGANWGYFTLLTLLPTYYDKILHMNIKSDGFISSLPYIANAIVSFSVSYITDKLRQKGFNITVLRKINNSIAFFGTGFYVIFFIIGLGLNGCIYSGVFATYVDMSPNYAGFLMGFSNTFATIPCIISPLIASQIYKNGQSLKTWSYVFYICFGIYFCTQIIYILFASSELQSWGMTTKTKTKKPNNVDHITNTKL
ncbi:sialin-like [Oppia nitens]|uniref:sialin-like n=1 Tax=Oppia nitens TaxID=1686743 RepID=UPI0023DAAD02|nr:sialin-like [Oppia nitens]